MRYLAIALVMAACASALAEDAPPQRTYVLIVSGLSAEPGEGRRMDDGVEALRGLFGAGRDAQFLHVLVDQSSTVRGAHGPATAEGLRNALAELAGKVTAADRVVFWYLGQANVVREELRLNLRGPDVTGAALAEMLKPVRAASMLVVLDCPGAGAAAKPLAGPGRLVVCAARADQPYSTRFTQFFVPALRAPVSDTDGDGRASLLEAFRRTAEMIDRDFSARGLMATETPLLEDDGDGTPSQSPWEFTEVEKDGEAASKFFLTVVTP